MPDELVLIVDDNEKNLRLARDVLQFAGFRTLEAASAGEGLSLAAEKLPDVILMDIRLPDMDGTEAARRLKDDARTTRIPVVALTSLAMKGESLTTGGRWRGIPAGRVDDEAGLVGTSGEREAAAVPTAGGMEMIAATR